MNLKRPGFGIILSLITTIVSGQDISSAISTIDKDLGDRRKTMSEVLMDTSLMYLHSQTPFRELIRKHAGAGEITIISPAEPGVRITVNGLVENRSGKPIVNALVYFYHTSDKGWYSDTGVHILQHEGDHRHARLFGYIKTDANGRFTIKTIRPNGYPKSDFAGHIHIQMWRDDGGPLAGIPGELQFEDDIRMTEERRRRSLADGFLIAPNKGTKENPVYDYTIIPETD